ncbi:MAG: nucleotidyltransferase domain-containing protein [Phycisphaerales bacterium]|nr:nucleotidyltransferase domain-containing protein [Phycisphaerales bacterium]
MTPSNDDIRQLTEALVREFRPQRVILFGSRASGQAGPSSDVDLLVVLPFSGSPIEIMSAMLARAYRSMKTPFAIDVHPRRPLGQGESPDPVMREAIERGVVLYEAAA